MRKRRSNLHRLCVLDCAATSVGRELIRRESWAMWGIAVTPRLEARENEGHATRTLRHGQWSVGECSELGDGWTRWPRARRNCSTS